MKQANVGTISTDQILVALSAITATITNIKLYPSASAIIVQSIDKAYGAVRDITRSTRTLEFAVMEGSLLVNGRPLGGKVQSMQHVSAFIRLMTEYNVRNMAFDHDMGKIDFQSVLSLFGKRAEEIEGEGGFDTLLKSDGISNITLEIKDYQTAVLRSSEAPRNPLSMPSGEAPSPAELQTIAVSAENIHWIESIINSVKQSPQEFDGATPVGEKAQEVGQMIGVMLQAVPHGESRTILANIAKTFSHLENDLVCELLDQGRESGLFEDLIDQMDQERLVNFVSWLHVILQKKMNGFQALTDSQLNVYKSNYEYLTSFQRVRSLDTQIRERVQKESRWQTLRIQKCMDGIKEILNGNVAHLSDELIMGSVPGIVGRLLDKGREGEAQRILDKLSEGLLSQESSARDCVSRTLFQVGRDLSDSGRKVELGRLAGKLNLWFKSEVDVFPAYRPMCDLMKEHVKDLVQEYQLEKANTILETFHLNHYGRVEKNDEIREISGAFLQGVCSPALLKLIFKEFRSDEHHAGKQAYSSLVWLGSLSVVPLLDLLKTSDTMAERVRIMGVLSDIGAPVLPSLVARITPAESWYYLRNLLKLLGDLGSHEHLEPLFPLFRHSNYQVHHAALNCVFDIGGSHRMKFFTRALQKADEKLKLKIVDLIGKLGEEEGVYHLTEILKSRDYDKVHLKNELDEAVCDALAKIGSKKAVPVLKAVVNQKGILGIGSYSAELCKVANQALEAIERKQQRPEKVKEVHSGNVPSGGGNGVASGDMDGQEGLLNEYLSQGKKAEAVKLLYDMIVISAKAKNFSRAESLRERLFQVDSMALREIIKSGEIIEEVKKRSIASEYMEIWAPLHDRLTDGEANALYYSMKTEVHDVDSVITRQGAMNSRLYFVNRGQVKVVYWKDEREYFLKVMGSGEMAGYDSFFPITVCTSSIVALSRATLGYIERDEFRELKKKFPELEGKLMTFCSGGFSVTDLVARKGLERRRYERLMVPGKVATQLTDESGKGMGSAFKGKLHDISMGGIAFRIRTAKEGLARLLLGRKVRVGVAIVTRNSPIQFSKTGTILSARYLEEGFFSFHLGFDDPVAESLIDSLITNVTPAP